MIEIIKRLLRVRLRNHWLVDYLGSTSRVTLIHNLMLELHLRVGTLLRHQVEAVHVLDRHAHHDTVLARALQTLGLRPVVVRVQSLLVHVLIVLIGFGLIAACTLILSLAAAFLNRLDLHDRVLRLELVDEVLLLREVVQLRHHHLLLRRLRELFIQRTMRLLGRVVSLHAVLLHVVLKRLLVCGRSLRGQHAYYGT